MGDVFYIHQPVDPYSAKELAKYCGKIALCVPWMLFWGTLGVTLLVTIIGIPLGVPALILAAWPFKKVEETRINQMVAWEGLSSTHAQGKIPWEL